MRWHRILDRHGGDAGKAGQQRRRRIAVRERPERHRQHEERDEQHHLRAQHEPHRGPSGAPPGRRRTHEGDDEDEFRQRQQLGDDAVGAEHRGSEGHEISRHMGGEEALQAEKARGIDESGDETQQRRNALVFHGFASQASGGPPRHLAGRRTDPCRAVTATTRSGAGRTQFLNGTIG